MAADQVNTKVEDFRIKLLNPDKIPVKTLTIEELHIVLNQVKV